MSTSKLKKVEDNFSARLNSLRMTHGWSQEDLALRLDVSNGSVGNWESGPTIPHPKMLRKIAALFEVEVSYLLKCEAPSAKAISLRESPVSHGTDDPLDDLLAAVDRAMTEMATVRRLAEKFKRSSSARRGGKQDTGRKIADIVKREAAEHLAQSAHLRER